MTFAEFEIGMRRLSAQFGKAAYGDERTRLIFAAVREFSAAWWNRTVDRFVAEFRIPPLMPEIRIEIAAERERMIERKRVEDRQAAEDFWSGKFLSEEKTVIVETIKRRMANQLSDAEWAQFLKLLPR